MVKVLVVDNVADPVILIYNALAGSVAPSATVVVLFSSASNTASVPKPKASPISSRFVLVTLPVGIVTGKQIQLEHYILR